MICDSCETVNHCLKHGCHPVTYISTFDKQVAGDHYKSKKIQPIEYIYANQLGFCEGNAVKYITRHKEKGGKADIEKAIHYLQMLLELEYSNVPG